MGQTRFRKPERETRKDTRAKKEHRGRSLEQTTSCHEDTHARAFPGIRTLFVGTAAQPKALPYSGVDASCTPILGNGDVQKP